MTNANPHIMINGQMQAAENASISVHDRGLRFGDGVFETIRIYQHTPYQWEQHLARLKAGLKALKINYDTATLLTHTLTLIQHNDVEHGTLRIMITRGEGSIGYLPHSDITPNVMIEANGKNFPRLEASTLWVSDYTKPSATSLPAHIKHMQGLNSSLAKIEARENSCTEALLLDDNGYICEAASGNIFWVKDGVIHTPSLSHPMVNGTMRSTILRLMPNHIKEGTWQLGALAEADEVFLSNSSWPIMPISVIKPLGTHYQSHSTASHLLTLIDEDMANYARRW